MGYPMRIAPGGNIGVDRRDIKTVRNTESAHSQNVATIASNLLLLPKKPHITLIAIHASVMKLT